MNTILGILPWIQIILAVLLVVAILLQAAEESLGGAFGGSTDTDSPSHTRRGAEKTLFKATIILAVLFVASILLPTII